MTTQALPTNLDPSTIADPDFRQLCEQIVDAMGRFKVPGVAVGVQHNGQEYLAGFGITSVEAPVPVDADTLFQIGSTSKTFTGTVAMMLAEQGKLDLDAPVRTYLPDLKLQDEAAAAGATMRHLFNHTGGWVGDYFDNTGMGDDALALIVARMADVPQLMPLGAVFTYNNAGFYIAGRVIEVVTGKPYETVVKEMIFDPLGMDHSFFFAEDAISRRTVVGHLVEDDKVTVARPWALGRSAHAAGGITSTVRDQLKYARFQLGDGTAPDGARLLTRAAMDEMQAPATPAGTSTGALGVTWMVKTLDGVKTVRHGGTTRGQLSAFVLAPERGFAITILTNSTRGGELHGEIANWALRHYLNIGEAEPEIVQRTPEELAAYTGMYTAAGSDRELTIRDGELVMQVIPKGGFPDKSVPAAPPPPPTRLALCQDDLVVALDPPFKGSRGEFLRDADGKVIWMRLGVRIATKE